MNIFVNGVKSKTGGGRSYLTNYLTLLSRGASVHRYFVLTPDRDLYTKFEAPHVQIVDIPRFLKANLLFLVLYRLVLPWLFWRHSIDCVFNLGDIVIPTNKRQVYFFDWPYAAYPRGKHWQGQGLSYWTRKIKLFWFRRYLRFATVVIAQTETMKKRLEIEYGLVGIEVVPNAVSLDNIAGGEGYDFGLPARNFKLLYLTHYYTHKNIEVFLPLARLIKERSLPISLVTTLAAAQHPAAERFLKQVSREELEGVIVNVGPVQMSAVPSLYAQCDGLLMPTLLETFSGTYVEAMFHGIPILTSDLDFAIDVCRDAAFYFDPHDPESIIEVIESARTDSKLRRRRVDLGRAYLEEFLTWEGVFERFTALVEIEGGRAK